VIQSSGLDTAVGDVVARFAPVHPPYAPGAHLYRDLGLSSVQVLQLLLALEAEFTVSLDDRRFIASATIFELTRLIEEAR
jgi:hypothetical protein